MAHFFPNPLPIAMHYCAGENYQVSPGGHDGTFLSSPSTRAAQLATLASGVTNRIMWHMPQGWTQGNVFAAPLSFILLEEYPSTAAAFADTITAQRAAGLQPIIYTGGCLPRANKGTGAAVLDARSQAAGADFAFARLRAEHAEWYTTQCAQLVGAAGASQLWFDAMYEAADLAAIKAIEAATEARGWFGQVGGGEALPLIFTGGGNANNIIDRTRTRAAPFLFLERNYAREFDPNNVWTFDPRREECHIIIDDGFDYWTRPVNQGGAGWTTAQALARLDGFVSRGMIVGVVRGSSSLVVDWWRAKYGPIWTGQNRSRAYRAAGALA